MLLPIQSYDFRSIRVDSPLLLIVNGKRQVMKSQSAAFVTYKPQSEWKPRERIYSENIESNEASVFSFCIYFVLFLFVSTGKLFVHIFQIISLFNFPLGCWWVSLLRLFCGLFHIWVVKIKIKKPRSVLKSYWSVKSYR